MRIAIVGAGPAGCHLAHRLAATDHEILLLDPRAPWEKPCGGGLGSLVSRHFPEVADKRHPTALPFPHHSPTRLLLRASDGSQVEQSFKQPPWSIVSRADLGRAMLERALANGHVRFLRQKVIDAQRSGDGWQVRTTSGQTFSADFLVGADGVQSIVRRRVVGPIPRRHLGLVVGYRVWGAPDALVFQTFSDLEGYLWSFPRLDHAHVGIGSRLGALPARELWQRLDRFFDEVCPEARKEGRWAALLPIAGDPTLWDTPCSGPGWALLGDAAGHVQPITGEGIAYALWSAELLAQAFAEGETLAYERLWRDRYGQELARASQTLQLGTAVSVGAYEMLFHAGLMAAVQGVGL